MEESLMQEVIRLRQENLQFQREIGWLSGAVEALLNRQAGATTELPRARTIAIVTDQNPAKGWNWSVWYEGERIAGGKHHVPLEVIALRKALYASRLVLDERFRADASPEELIRADQWEANARLVAHEAVAHGNAAKKRALRIPVTLECGHIRMVKRNTQVGSDQVNCGPCGTHRLVASLVTEAPRA